MNRAEILAHAERFIAYRRAKTSKPPPSGPLYFFRGEMLTATEIMARTGLSRSTITLRVKAGLPLHHADKRRMTDEERVRLGLGPRFPETGA